MNKAEKTGACRHDAGSAHEKEIARRRPQIMVYDAKTMRAEKLLYGLKSREDGTYLDSLVELRDMVLGKRHGHAEVFITQKIIDAAANTDKEPQKRFNAIYALREIAVRRSDSREISGRVLNSMPRIFRNRNDLPDLREEALSTLHEILRHGGYTPGFSKELAQTISDTAHMILEDSLTYRYLASSTLQELAKHAVKAKNSHVEAEMAKALNNAYERTADADVRAELDCISQIIIKGSCG